MEVKIGYTSKRIIETGAHPFEGGHTLECKLKEPCSMQSPVFKVQGIVKGALFNYAQFENRYYWIDDIVYLNRHIQEVHCHLDPIATYQAKIKDTHALVKYGDEAHWNIYIDDLRFSPEKLFATTASDAIQGNECPAFGFRSNQSGEGMFVVTVMQFFDANHQGVNTYAMTATTFYNMLLDLAGYMTNRVPGTINTIVETLQAITEIWGQIGGAGSWRDNILEVRYVLAPEQVYADNCLSSDTDMYIGGVMCGLGRQYYKMSRSTWVRHNKAITIPWHQQIMTDYRFLKNPRWSSLQLITPGGNFQDIDITNLQLATSVGWYSCIDICSGKWTGKLCYPNERNGEILAACNGDIGMDVSQMAGSGASYASILSSNLVKGAAYGMSGFSSVQSGSQTSAATQLRAEPIDSGNAAQIFNQGATDNYNYSTGVQGSFLPSGLSISSASGSFSGDITNFGLYKTGERPYRDLVSLRLTTFAPENLTSYKDYCDLYGYPCNHYLKLGDLSGYVCCVGACLEDCNMISPSNQSTINSTMNTGIYISPSS